MKKLLLNGLSLALITISSSQIVFTKELIDTYGDTTVTAGIKNVADINLGNAGANQIWDFSNVRLSDTVAFATRLPYSSAYPHASEFPNANYVSAELQIDPSGNITVDPSSYAYLLMTDNKYQLLGTAGTEEINFYLAQRVEKFSPFEDAFKLPFDYNEVLNYTTNSVATTSAEGDTLIDNKTGTGSYTYEGYGKVTMPGSSTQENCARFKRVESSTTLEVSPSDEGDFVDQTTITIEQYDFISEKYATLSVISATYTLLSTFTMDTEVDTMSSQTQSYQYGTFERSTSKNEIQQIALGVNDDKIFAGIEVYPNPTTTQINVSNQPNVQSVEVIGTDGTTTLVNNFANGFAIEGAKGLYMVRVKLASGATKSYKVVKN